MIKLMFICHGKSRWSALLSAETGQYVPGNIGVNMNVCIHLGLEDRRMVVFYGSNSWAYTRLGHITDKNPKEMTELLSGGNVTITLSIS